MTKLRCVNCGKQSAFVTTKGKLEELTNAPVGIVGAIDPTIVVVALKVLMQVIGGVTGFFANRNQKYVVCSSCGHYEKLD